MYYYVTSLLFRQNNSTLKRYRGPAVNMVILRRPAWGQHTFIYLVRDHDGSWPFNKSIKSGPLERKRNLRSERHLSSLERRQGSLDANFLSTWRALSWLAFNIFRVWLQDGFTWPKKRLKKTCGPNIYAEKPQWKGLCRSQILRKTPLVAPWHDTPEHLPWRETAKSVDVVKKEMWSKDGRGM